MASPTRRLFVGLLPDGQVQAGLERHCRAWTWPKNARTTPCDRYHLTLHFLGNVAEAPEQRLRRAFRAVAGEPLELELRLAELWPNGVAVLRPIGSDELGALRERVTLAMLGEGFSPEIQFQPHVTLARNAVRAIPPQCGEPICWSVSEFALVWSLLWPQAKPARYEGYRALWPGTTRYPNCSRRNDQAKSLTPFSPMDAENPELTRRRNTWTGELRQRGWRRWC